MLNNPQNVVLVRMKIQDYKEFPDWANVISEGLHSVEHTFSLAEKAA